MVSVRTLDGPDPRSQPTVVTTLSRKMGWRALLGASLAGQKKYADAMPLLVEGYTGMLARKNRMAALDHYHLDRGREWLVQLYRALGQPEKAAELAQALPNPTTQ